MSDPSESLHNWFCLRTQPKREHIAAAVLAKVNEVEVFCPRISQHKKTRSGKRRYIEALFPGYIFAKFNFQSHYRQVIHSLGITRMVEIGDRRVVPDRVVEDLRDSLPRGVIEAPDPSIEPGADIEVLSGSLKGLNGTVLGQLPAKNRIQILLDFLGQEIKVAVNSEDIILAEKQQ